MEKAFTIYFTSDTHGYLYPTTYLNSTDAPCGLMKIIEAFTPGENTLVLDGGDTLQGSPFTLYASRSGRHYAPVAKVLNLGGYNFVTLGNHDFNYGLTPLTAYLNALNAKCLCANIRAKNGSLPVQPSATVTLENGLKIGLVGICTDHVKIWEKPETVAQLNITCPFKAAKAELEKLKPCCDFTVCIYHGGYEVDLATGAPLTGSTENIAGRLSKELAFDILLTGHQHMPIANLCLFGTHGVQTPANATGFCKVTATLQPNGQKHIESVLLPPAAAANPAAYTEFLPLENAVQHWLDTPVGTLAMPLPAGCKLGTAINGSLVANFINQIQLAATGAQISAVGLPNQISGFGKNVTVRDIVSTYIFSNTLVVLEMSGATIKAYFERCAEYFDLDETGKPVISQRFLTPKVEHYNYDFFAGVEYTFNLNAPIGQRVVKMVVGGKEVLQNATYTVCVNSYRATGTGGYPFLAGCKILQQGGTDVIELITAYIENAKGVIEVDTAKYLTLQY